MADMTTALSRMGGDTNSATYATSGHTASKPKLVLAKRRVPVGQQVVEEATISVVQATEDADGLVLDQKYSISIVARGPKNGTTSDKTACGVIMQDFVASDQFSNWLSGSYFPDQTPPA